MNRLDLTRIISAFVLGDGYLRMWKNGKNAAYGLSQIDIHKDYVYWQKEILEELTSVTIRHYSESTKDGVHRQGHYKLETKCHPFYTTLYERIYFDSRKTVSTHDLELFNWQSAAIWYMDDGYRLKSEDKSQRGNVFLCTDNYTHAEIILLQKTIYNHLNIPFNIRMRGKKKDGTQIYRLVATKNNADRFIEGVEPFLFPSFRYKLYSERIPLDKSDEIV